MRSALVFLCLVLAAFGRAEKSYIGLYMQGTRIGYAVSQSFDVNEHGAVLRSDSKTVMSAGLLGSDVKVIINSSTWSDAQDKTVRMEFNVESAGRTQSTLARFVSAQKIELDVDNNGQKTQRTIDIPVGAKVVDDAVAAISLEGMGKGSKQTVYVLDPMTATLVKNEVELVGPTKTIVKGQTFSAYLILVKEPRATTRAFMSAKGDLIKIEGPMGMEMIPCTEEEALAEIGPRPNTADLAFGTAIRPNKTIDPASLKRLRLRITGTDLGRLPSDEHQSTKKEKSGWILEIHPAPLDRATTIEQAASQKPDWIKPSMNISCEAPEIQSLAKEFVGSATTVADATERIRRGVNRLMRPDAGIGVLRDATEVLKTKEGVCRDYATLCAALLRAAKVPTRLASGLVYQDGAFYYHAWVEVWDGYRWTAQDPTRDEKVGAGHLKLAHGNVEEAFTFTVLDKVKMEVVSAR